MINSSLYAYVNDENYFKYYRGVYKLNENREWEMIKRTPYDIKEEFFFTKDHCNLIHTEEVNENERVTQIDICG